MSVLVYSGYMQLNLYAREAANKMGIMLKAVSVICKVDNSQSCLSGSTSPIVIT